MNNSTVLVAVFLAVVSAHRVWEGFKPRGLVLGERQMTWSFYVFFGLHSLITIGALVEYLLLGNGLRVGWSLLAFVLLVGAVWLRHYAIQTLGKFWSLHLEIRQQHQLVRTGVYNVLRHPAYTSILVEVVAIPLFANAWWTMLAALLLYWPLLMLRLVLEERALVAKFGESYRAYQREVGALFPRLGFVHRK